MPEISRYEHELVSYGMKELAKIKGLHLIGTASQKSSALSFVLDGYDNEAVGQHLDKYGIAVRTGHHCAQPILRSYGLEGVVRPTLALYNSPEDIDRLVRAIRSLILILQNSKNIFHADGRKKLPSENFQTEGAIMHKLESEVNKLIGDILSDYESGRDIDNIQTFDHPKKEVIIEIVEKLRNIIFPGFFKNGTYRIYTVRNNMTMLLEDVLYNLIKQISIVLRYVPEYENADEVDIADEAERLALKFLGTIPKIREYVDTDVQAAYDGDPAAFNKDEIIFSYPGLFAVMVNRIAHELYLLNIPLIPRIMTEYAHSVTGIDIHPGAQIGKYFFIDHGTGIVIGETTVIGDNVKIYQGVTLGALSTRGGQKLKSQKRHPTIDDNVTIYSGASILGGETVVGKNVVVGGNAFITKSIPEGARVSIKNQELRYNYDAAHPVQRAELEVDESWFYVI